MMVSRLWTTIKDGTPVIQIIVDAKSWGIYDYPYDINKSLKDNHRDSVREVFKKMYNDKEFKYFGVQEDENGNFFWIHPSDLIEVENGI